MKLNISTEVAELISHIADVQIKALLNIQQGNYQIDEEDQELLSYNSNCTKGSKGCNLSFPGYEKGTIINRYHFKSIPIYNAAYPISNRRRIPK